MFFFLFTCKQTYVLVQYSNVMYGISQPNEHSKGDLGLFIFEIPLTKALVGSEV